MTKEEKREQRKKRKARKRENNKLVALHKTVFKNYLNTQQKLDPSEMVRVLSLYESKIGWTNIEDFYYRSMAVFHNALVTDRLNDIRKYKMEEVS